MTDWTKRLADRRRAWAEFERSALFVDVVVMAAVLALALAVAILLTGVVR